MAELMSKLKRGGQEMAQESAKTDGMTKGGAVNTGGKGPVDMGSRGGKEYAQDSAKCDGMCK
jgi:hypothetical protein